MFGKPTAIPSKSDALPGRSERMPVPDTHFVNHNRLAPPFPDGLARLPQPGTAPFGRISGWYGVHQPEAS